MESEKPITRIHEDHLPDHHPDPDGVPETGTPAGTISREATLRPRGSFSEASCETIEADRPGKPRMERGDTSATLTETEREAVALAFEGPSLRPGDLAQESDYEVTRDREAGGEQVVDANEGARNGDHTANEGAK